MIAAHELADRLVRNGPLTMAVSKPVLREGVHWGEDMFERQHELTAPVFKSADAREGAAAFAEKRTPAWQGR
jgi:enoyl-CoA hydratase